MAPGCQAELAAAHKVLKVWELVFVADQHAITKLVGFIQPPQLLQDKYNTAGMSTASVW
jgi:hypothetical protein